MHVCIYEIYAHIHRHSNCACMCICIMRMYLYIHMHLRVHVCLCICMWHVYMHAYHHYMWHIYMHAYRHICELYTCMHTVIYVSYIHACVPWLQHNTLYTIPCTLLAPNTATATLLAPNTIQYYTSQDKMHCTGRTWCLQSSSYIASTQSWTSLTMPIMPA